LRSVVATAAANAAVPTVTVTAAAAAAARTYFVAFHCAVPLKKLSAAHALPNLRAV